ncbi:hypothetical protein D3C86_1975610 [compost metagenome]
MFCRSFRRMALFIVSIASGFSVNVFFENTVSIKPNENGRFPYFSKAWIESKRFCFAILLSAKEWVSLKMSP